MLTPTFGILSDMSFYVTYKSNWLKTVYSQDCRLIAKAMIVCIKK